MADDDDYDYDYEKLFLRPLDAVARGQKSACQMRIKKLTIIL